MKYQIICNGDSWTFGCELTDPEVDRKYGGPVKVYRGEYDYFEENIPYRTARIWPTYLRRYLDCQTVNLSWPADDNTTIYNRTIDYVTREYLSKSRSTENLVIIIGWTSPERNSFCGKMMNGIGSLDYGPMCPILIDLSKRNFGNSTFLICGPHQNLSLGILTIT